MGDRGGDRGPKLGGYGTVLGDVTIAGGAILAPGGSLGGDTTDQQLYIVCAGVAEPSTFALAGLGLAGLAWRLRRRRRAA